MSLPPNKTKIVCTIGPASESPEVLERMLRAGMNVARLNLSHGDFDGHHRRIELLRAAARKVDRRVALLADLPGPKLRIGELRPEPVELRAGDRLVLTTEEVVGSAARIPVDFPRLPQVVSPQDRIFLNDGLIELTVLEIRGSDVTCEVRAGGELRSRKGLNLPGIELGIPAFTDQDRAALAFVLEHGVDAVGQSFVGTAEDVHAVRDAARQLGREPFVIAKIERAGALEHLDGILEAADGIMVARGDLGVEIPIARIAGVQKDLVRRANLAGKPVITATQMLESMTHQRLPTRAEATDVANAILDGTDAVMLSGESAMGRFPVEAVEMLAAIAADVEGLRPGRPARAALAGGSTERTVSRVDLIAHAVESTFDRACPAAVIVRTEQGHSARSITRLRLPSWILAVTDREQTCQELQLSYGVHPVLSHEKPADVRAFVTDLLRRHGLSGRLVVLAEGASPDHPADSRMGILELGA